MANIITIADFSKPYVVYAVDSEDSGTILDELITYYEKIILTQILGEQEYNDYIANPTETEWVNFVDGVTYTYDSISYVYPGIKPVLTKMMYYYWQVDAQQRLGERGSLNPTLLNSDKVIPRQKMVRAFNEAKDEIRNNRTYSPTVYHYLYHMQENNDYFPNWEYTEFYHINQYNL
jgi:hypothetical protein